MIASSTGMTWTVPSDELGAYGYWLDEIGSPYTLTVTKPGYETGMLNDVIIVGQGTTTLDFDLRWLVPCMSFAPDALPLTLEMGMTGTRALTLTNLGGGEASFEMIERDHGRSTDRGPEFVELTIPSAPDFPPEGSAVAAGPYTPRSERVMTIERQPVLSEPISVLLLHADDGNGQWIKDQLLVYGDLGVVDAYNARFGTPGLDDLLAYDVVLTWTNYKYQDPITIGDLLADYVDRGGKVINLMYALGTHGWEMKGRFISENYTAMNGGLVEYSTACIGGTNPTHPILEGVTSVCEFYRLKDTFLTPGSSAVARWEDNELFTAVNGDSTVISIAGYVGYYFRWTGQMDLLIHNAIQWLALGYDIPWLITDPVTGTVSADNGITTVEVFFDSLNYQPEVFRADLNARSNDPYKPDLQVPVTMTVEPTASMGWVEGIITDLRTGAPLEASIIAYGQPYTVTSDAETGFYQFWLEQGTNTIEVGAPGYVTQTATVEITAQQGITQDFALLLDAPWMQVAPEVLESTQRVNQVVTQTLVLTNTGAAALDFELLRGTGLPLHIVSDDNWRVSNMLEPGWETVNFDDTSWEFSVAPAPVNCGTINCWSDPNVFSMWSEIQYQTIYLRRSFSVGSGVISATIKTECDDDHDLYVNGILGSIGLERLCWPDDHYRRYRLCAPGRESDCYQGQ